MALGNLLVAEFWVQRFWFSDRGVRGVGFGSLGVWGLTGFMGLGA